MNFKNEKKGFTLIELLVVIAIIGLLATLAVVALGNARQKSRDAKRVSDIKQIQTALELRYVEAEDYPGEFVDDVDPQVTACAAASGCSLGVEVTCLDNVGWKVSGCDAPIYMGLVPKDPSAGAAPATCLGASGDVVGCNYNYNLDGGTGNYTIHFILEGNTGGLSGGGPNLEHCASQNGISNDANCP